MKEKVIDRFIETWGEMGTLWGLNSSIARVHALLIVSEEPISLDYISKRLKISRGNSSMCLKELRNWGVIKRVKVPGDRQDYYVTVPDIWSMFFAIAREKKRREFDPSFSSVKDTLANAREESSGKVLARLKQMEEFMEILDKIADRFLYNEGQAKFFLDFLAGAAK